MAAAPAGLQEWTVGASEDGSVARLAGEIGCPRAIAAWLVSRGIASTDAAHKFFNPTLDDLLDPMLMLGMPVAVARIQQAVRASEPILIYGDYDVDGTTATVLLKTAI